MYFKACSIPFALKRKVEQELERLESQDDITPVPFSEWTTPIVPVVKMMVLYVCVVIINSQQAKYPKLACILYQNLNNSASLSGDQTFSKLDLSHVYLQVPLAEESQKYLVIIAHKRLYAYKRLPFGVAFAPAVFQCIMDNILQGLSGVCTYLDDILVTGKTADKHIKNLNAVLTCLCEAGIRLKKTECQFSLRNVEYLGHVISSKGLEPAISKVTAIVDFPVASPCNIIIAIKSLLGLVNYYRKFLPSLSTTLAPLYRLLWQGV